MGGANPAEFVADNVTYGDVSKVVQQNTAYYLSVFRNIKSFGRSKFNFSAFLFSGGWLLYRKQYKAGIITTNNHVPFIYREPDALVFRRQPHHDARHR